VKRRTFSRWTRGGTTRAGIAVLFCLIVAAGAGCDREDSREPTCPTCTTCPWGSISGQVLGGGRPVAARVRAECVRGDSSGSAAGSVVEGETDVDGRFRIDVPSGRYTLEVSNLYNTPGPFFDFRYSADGLASRYTDADTFEVRRESVEKVMAGGALDLLVHTPDRLEGVTLFCEITGLTGAATGYTSSFSANVAEGTVRYHFPLLPVGTYAARLGGAPMQTIWLPGALDQETARKIPVNTGILATAEVTLPPAAWISGSITGSWQTIGFAPDVIALDAPPESGRGYLARTRVGRDGQFSLCFFVLAPVRLLVDYGETERWIGGDDFASARVFDLAAGREFPDVSLRDSGILCRLEGDGLGPETNARFKLFDEHGTIVADRSHMGGDLAPIAGLKEGVYFLRVERADNTATWAPQWFDRKPSLAEASPITLTGWGEVATVTVRLQEGGRIRGDVRDRSGAPVQAIIVAVPLDGPDGARVFASSNRSTGEFTLEGLADGEYRIGAARDYNNLQTPLWWYPGTSDPDSAGVITIRDLGEVTGLSWRLPDERGSLVMTPCQRESGTGEGAGAASTGRFE
jgi:hypothetical protein